MRKNRSRAKEWHPMAILGCSILMALMAGEMAVRLCGQVDKDGNFFVGKFKIFPYYLPVKTLQMQVNEYLSSKDSCMVYDRNLGWAPRPGSMGRNGLYFYNKDA